MRSANFQVVLLESVTESELKVVGSLQGHQPGGPLLVRTDPEPGVVGGPHVASLLRAYMVADWRAPSAPLASGNFQVR